jgi:hypothetical protein
MFNWFWEFLYGLIKVPLFCIDFVLQLANLLCGIEPVVVDGAETDLVFYFLSSSSVFDAFKYICIIAFELLFLFTIFSIIRAQGNFYENKSPLHRCLDSGKTILYFLFVPAMMLLGAQFVSALMQSVYMATSQGGAGLGSSMFAIYAEEAYIGDAEKKMEVMDLFLQKAEGYDYYSTSDVTTYFQLSKFNYFLGLLTSITVLVLLALALLNFVERIISLVTLFIVAPLSVSTSALDDGVRFKLWRDQVISKFLVAYGTLIGINIFSLLISVIFRIEFFTPESLAALHFPVGLCNFMNGLARLAFAVGGALACNRSIILIGNLVNQGAGSQEAADQSHTSPGVAKALGAVGSVAMLPVKGAAKLAGAGLGKLWNVTTSAIKDAVTGDGSSGGAAAKSAAGGAEDAFRGRASATPKKDQQTSGDSALQQALENHKENESAGDSVKPTLPTASAPASQETGTAQGNDSSINRDSKDTIESAMQNSKQNEGGGSAE